MATIIISQRDRDEAEAFLETILTEALPGENFSRGTYLRDVTITALAHTVAYLRKESRLALERTSIRKVLDMAPGPDRDEAADDLMSNWFVARKTGGKSRGVVSVRLVPGAQQVTIPPSATFNYDGALSFVPDSTVSQVFDVNDFSPLYDSTGTVIAQYFQLPVIASASGGAYDVSPARWLSWSAFSSYVVAVESTTPFSGGSGAEDTDTFLSRAGSAVSTKDLVSQRSITSRLVELFPNINDIYVVGAGDPEMYRDLMYVGGVSDVHIGGCTDVYVSSPVGRATTFTANVGGTFADPRPGITSLSSVATGNFVLAGVQPGHVLLLSDTVAGQQSTYTVDAVTSGYVSVSSRSPFPAARNGVSFSIGTNAPNYNNIVAAKTDGVLSKALTMSRRIMLPQMPIYRISEASYWNGSAWQPLTRSNKDPNDGNWGNMSVPAQYYGYRLYYMNPSAAYTADQVAVMFFGGGVPDNALVRVVYDTLPDFAAISAYMTSELDRVAPSSVLPRAMYPVYVTLNIPYTRRARATTALDTQAASYALAGFINSFPATEVLTISDITTFLQVNYGGVISSIPRFVASYDLFAPDGRVVNYASVADGAATSDTIEVLADRETSVPGLLPYPLGVGISSRNLIYLTSPDLISFNEQLT